MGSEGPTGLRRRTKTTTTTTLTMNYRSILFVAFAILVSFVAERVGVARAAQAQQLSAWPQFRGNSHMTGLAASDVPQTLTLKWTYQAGESIESSAAVAEGVVYVGAGDGNLPAVDLESGQRKWKYATGNPIGESSPAVSGGLVYIGDLGGVVHAVHAGDGTSAWTTPPRSPMY